MGAPAQTRLQFGRLRGFGGQRDKSCDPPDYEPSWNLLLAQELRGRLCPAAVAWGFRPGWRTPYQVILDRVARGVAGLENPAGVQIELWDGGLGALHLGQCGSVSSCLAAICSAFSEARNSKKHNRHFRLRRSNRRLRRLSLYSLQSQANSTTPKVQHASSDPREEMLTRNMADQRFISSSVAHEKTLGMK